MSKLSKYILANQGYTYRPRVRLIERISWAISGTVIIGFILFILCIVAIIALVTLEIGGIL